MTDPTPSAAPQESDAVAELVTRLEREHAEALAACEPELREYRERYGFPERLGGPFSLELHRRASVRMLVDVEQRSRDHAEQARADGKRREARDLERLADELAELRESLGPVPEEPSP